MAVLSAGGGHFERCAGGWWAGWRAAGDGGKCRFRYPIRGIRGVAEKGAWVVETGVYICCTSIFFTLLFTPHSLRSCLCFGVLRQGVGAGKTDGVVWLWASSEKIKTDYCEANARNMGGCEDCHEAFSLKREIYKGGSYIQVSLIYTTKSYINLSFI